MVVIILAIKYGRLVMIDLQSLPEDCFILSLIKWMAAQIFWRLFVTSNDQDRGTKDKYI